MPDLRVYGLQDGLNNKFYFPLLDPGVSDGSFKTGATLAAADSQIMKDGGAFTQTNSAVVEEGNGYYSILLNGSGEMTAGIIVVTIIDQDATKTYMDQSLIIHTIAHSSALHHGASG